MTQKGRLYSGEIAEWLTSLFGPLPHEEKGHILTIETTTYDDGWEKRNPEFITFEKIGYELVGKLGPSERILIDGQEVERYTVETSEGPVAFLGGAQLDSLLMGLLVDTEIKLVYTGKAKGRTGREFKTFDLFTRKG